MAISPLKNTARNIFGNLYSSYDFVLDYFTFFQDRYWKRLLLKSASITSTSSILDVGCGTGVLEESFVGSGDLTVIGVDITKEMLEIARKKKYSFFELIAADAEFLPFRPGCFDDVLSCYVIKYCDYEKFASQIRSVLKPGGRLVLYDFDKPHGGFALFHIFYLYGVLRLLGILTRRLDSGMSITFSELPDIISGTDWSERLNQILPSLGFEGIIFRYMTGGAATLFCAVKPMER